MDWMLWFYGAGAAVGAGFASHVSRNFDQDTRKIFLVAGGLAGFGVIKALFDVIAIIFMIGVGAKVYATFKPQIDQMTTSFFGGKTPQDRMDKDDSGVIDRLRDLGMDDDEIDKLFEDK